MNHPITQRFWNIFQCVLEALGEDEFQRVHTVQNLINSFENIMIALNIAQPVIFMVTRFINFAIRIYNFIRSYMGGSRPLQY